MKMQIKNSHKVITGITLLVALLFIMAFKAVENIEQVQNRSGSEINTNSLFIDVLLKSDKVEALKKFFTGWQEVKR